MMDGYLEIEPPISDAFAPFVDFMPPSSSGVDVLRAVYNLQPNAGIVLMTGANPRCSAQPVKDFGGLDNLRKSIDPERLTRHLDALAGKLDKQ